MKFIIATLLIASVLSSNLLGGWTQTTEINQTHIDEAKNTFKNAVAGNGVMFNNQGIMDGKTLVFRASKLVNGVIKMFVLKHGLGKPFNLILRV